MSADTVVRARIDNDTKERATEALRAMGLSVSDAIRLLMLRIADEKRLPFSIQAPNPTTVEAMKELAEVKASASTALKNYSGYRHLKCCYRSVPPGSSATSRRLRSVAKT